MRGRHVLVTAGFLFTFAAGFITRGMTPPMPVVHAAPAADRVFEIRTYIASAQKFDPLKARFRDHTLRFFQRHNLNGVGYWTPVAGTPGAGNTLIYILAHESREAATKNWAAFNADPEWLKVRTESIANGNPVARVDSMFVEPVDFSPIK